MLFKNGITLDDTQDEDLYAMLLPGETDYLGTRGCISQKK
jgi:hypothetical protein